MSVFQLALCVGAVVAALLAWKVERSWLWIAAGVASFVASTAWARYDLPLPPLFTALCDASVCLLIYGLARQRFELILFQLFQASVLVSIVFLSLQFLSPGAAHHAVYVSILEAINWAALALISGTGIIKWISVYGDRHHRGHGRVVRWAQRTLLSPKTTNPWGWWKA
jgi:hypothetical protein